MKVLITSGGTKVQIDPIRFIANTSQGAFGTRLANESLRRGHQTYFLYAKNSDAPFEFYLSYEDFKQPGVFDKLSTMTKMFREQGDKYTPIPYFTFEEYEKRLFETITNIQPDVIVLCAAVSDYGVKPSAEKIRTAGDLTLQLHELPKLISKVKDVAPKSVLVGFKLFTHASDAQLIAAARESIVKNKCDVVVTNNYETVNKRIIIVDKYDKCTQLEETEAFAPSVLDAAFKVWENGKKKALKKSPYNTYNVTYNDYD